MAYGELWECPDCGRRWNTTQIPPEEYWGIMRDQRRYRMQAMGVALAIALGFVVLVAATSSRALILAPLLIGGWFFLYMPQWRRRVRAKARNLPRWQLRPE